MLKSLSNDWTDDENHMCSQLTIKAISIKSYLNSYLKYYFFFKLYFPICCQIKDFWNVLKDIENHWKLKTSIELRINWFNLIVVKLERERERERERGEGGEREWIKIHFKNFKFFIFSHWMDRK